MLTHAEPVWTLENLPTLKPGSIKGPQQHASQDPSAPLLK